MSYRTDLIKFQESQVADFIKHMHGEDKAPPTIRLYTEYLFLLYRRFGVRPDMLVEIEQSQLSSYIRTLEKSNSPKSIMKYIDAINAYYRFVLRPDLRLKRNRVQPKQFISNTIAVDEATRLIKHLKDRGKDDLYVLVSLLYHTGLRIGEALRVKTDDITKSAPYTIGKRKVRQFFINATLKHILNQYVQKYEITGELLQRLYPSADIPSRISRINHALKHYGSQCHIDKFKLHCHSFRHLFCIRLLKELDIATVSSIVGHASINTTMLYLRRSEQELYDVFNRLD